MTTKLRRKKKGTSKSGTRKFKNYGVRNRLEQKVLDILSSTCSDFAGYETDKLRYIKPESYHIYTPDFKVGDTYYETKGIWDSDDRKKMLLVKDQYPNNTFVLVFYNPNYRIYKGSKTTYAAWCESHGFEWTTADQLAEELTRKEKEKK